MPSLFRFVFLMGLLAGVAYGSLFVLDKYFEPTAKERIDTVPNVRIRR